MQDLSFLGFKGYFVTEYGDVYSEKTKKFLNLQHNDNGYVCVTIRLDGKTKTLRTHRLVAMTYLKDSFFEGAHVNHIDGNKTNNHVSNLEWVDRIANMRHAHKTGLILAKPCTLSDEAVMEVCQMLQDGVSISVVSKSKNIRREKIYQILRGGIFKDISSKYDLTNVNKQTMLPDEKVVEVCEALQKGLLVTQIASITGVHPSTVKQIKYRRTRTEISNNYNWSLNNARKNDNRSGICSTRTVLNE